MTVATWCKGSTFKADAQKCANEIDELGEYVTPYDVLERAKDSSTELHKCFEWDDTKAAEKYRVAQAGKILRSLVMVQVKDPEPKKKMPGIRYTFKTIGSPGYKRTELILQQPDEYQRLLATAMRELQQFKNKYSCLSELKDIFDLIP